MEMNVALYKKRQRTNAIGLTLSMTAMVLGLPVLLLVRIAPYTGIRIWPPWV